LLEKALADFRDGVVSLGGLGAIGYGRIGDFEVAEESGTWLKIPEKKLPEDSVQCGERYRFSSDPATRFEKEKIFYPHYFLKPSDEDVRRETRLVSHVYQEDTDGKTRLLTGTIRCRLTTEGPIFIPDTDDPKEDYFQMEIEGHKSYGFFRINEQVAIPGSSIRGMVSSVFEALTNSCFRVFDQKRYLSRSTKPDPRELEKYLPGKVKRIDNKWVLLELEDIFRLPLYDLKDVGPKSLDSAYGLEKFKNEKRFRLKKIENAVAFNKKMAGYAKHNREFLKNNYTETELGKILRGEMKVWFTIGHKPNSAHDNDKIALLTKKTNKRAKSGFIKFTGPSMVNIKADASNSDCEECRFDMKSEDKDGLIFHNAIECRPSQKKEYPRPVLKCVKEAVEYTMIKRCEQVFSEGKKPPRSYSIPDKIRRQYNGILKDNRDNTEHIPSFFRNRMKNKELSDEDLVYFRYKGKKVTNIAPVRVSRTVDDTPLGKRLPNDSLRPCHHQTCLEDCEACEDSPDLCEKLSEYFSPHPNGFCPACHLFGTTYYKGRVGFGMAWLENDAPKWYVRTESPKKGGQLTLPLLERPRPTWPMPSKEDMRGKESEIPGRKFYVHHPWSVEAIKDKPVTPNKNNRTAEPLAKGNTFVFEISFNNLREWELGLLLYSLELEDNLAHKLGMGKALGMGSVRIKAEEISLRDGSGEKRDKAAFIKKGFDHLEIRNKADVDLEKFRHIRELRKLLWFSHENTPASVRYPSLEKDDKGIPGYTDLMSENDPKTGRKNPSHLLPRNRSKLLQRPWTNWHPIPAQLKK